MKPFHIHKDWEDPQGAKGFELRATWGALRIETVNRTGTRTITRLLDRRANTVRDRVYAPLYPLAEWLAFHWFQLLFGTKATDTRKNHGLLHAAEGFALPDFSIWSEGASLRLEWEPRSYPQAQVDFLDFGYSLLPRQHVQQELADFVAGVIRRLEEKSVRGTPLQAEWESITALDEEQIRFSIAAATLGFDPFNLPEEAEAKILGIDVFLSQTLQEEFLPVASAEALTEQAEAVSMAIDALKSRRRDSSRLEEARGRLGTKSSGHTPWEVGYALAREARELLGIAPGPVKFETLEGIVHPSEISELSVVAGVEGLVARNGSNAATAVSPLLSGRHPSYRKFILARALYENLTSSPATSSMLTTSSTERQRTGRAFAAEFLAPATEIASLVKGAWVSSSEIQEIADHFSVSSMVIDHQVRNHEIALIEE